MASVWGVLRLHDVAPGPATALLDQRGSGVAILHSTSPGSGRRASRPLPALAARVRAPIADVLITLGRARARITANLLVTLTASWLAAAGYAPASQSSSTAVPACGNTGRSDSAGRTRTVGGRRRGRRSAPLEVLGRLA
ncbi:hypothetical protein [Actinoplanes siamensis]|uniref:Uncharacterized protein n=1 Tax=Actinoplanes siamensis TaxID=1223317 RepID=A0A919TKP8_9ACTN|nr:hypothetical protein [Actinoplanes siamensis]GIF05543.1 hypothetical protein Asi03nite_30810 [Actinoplanes siamensis]